MPNTALRDEFGMKFGIAPDTESHITAVKRYCTDWYEI